MSIILSIPLFFMVLISSFADVRPLGETFTLSSIRTIVITGDASSTKITTKSNEPYRAETNGRRGGWFSSWYSSWVFNICKDESRAEIDGATLTIDVATSAWSDIADCSPEVSANIPPGSAVQAFMAKLNGDFASLSTSRKAADITLDGHASTVDISGAAVRASLTYDAVKRDEKIEIAAQSLDAYLGFGKDVPVDYTVTARTPYIDSLVPSVPGVHSLVSIKGDYVRARIR